jgi:SAM-dependent methyltransferase
VRTVAALGRIGYSEVPPGSIEKDEPARRTRRESKGAFQRRHRWCGEALSRVRFPPLLSWRTLDRALLPDGSEMTLARRGEEHSIRIDGDVLMTSNSHGSEEKLAERGCAGLDALPQARVLVGGLGMGFTARAALAALRSDAIVDVVELVGAVVRWNRELIGHLADAPLLDPRVQLVEGDVAVAIGTARERYDAILLDVDNGPEAFTARENKHLYSLEGLRRARRALRPGGVVAIWSMFESREFTARLREANLETRLVRVRANGHSKRLHALWLGRRSSA